MMKRLLLLFPVAMAVALSGCNGNDSGKYRIAVIPKGTSHQFWKSVRAGAENAAKELGNVEILWQGPAEEDDTEEQIKMVNQSRVNQVDGILLAPNDSTALVQSVSAAGDDDIPVVIYDSDLDRKALQAEGGSIVSYVATRNKEGGKLAARRLAEVLGGQGNVVLLRYRVGSESTEQREEGFLEAMREEFPDINLLETKQHGGKNVDTAKSAMTQLLNRFNGVDEPKVEGVFAVCEPNGLGVLEALRDADELGKVKFVTFDPADKLIEAMRDGHVHGIVLQDPVTMGYKAVKAMVRHLEGESVEERIPTGEYLATPENMDQPKMKKLLNPEIYE